MKAIVAVDLDWGIGYKGNLLEKIPEDMKYFKQTTLGKIVVMGRETFESLPGKEPLKDRINIVLSANGYFDDNRLIICRSLNELFRELEKYSESDVFVIGGESVYTQLLPYCTEVYVTKIEKKYKADKHFCNLDKIETWKQVSQSEVKISNDIKYNFVGYVNNKPIELNAFYKQP